MKDISAYIDTLHSQRNQRGNRCASSWRMKAISFYFLIQIPCTIMLQAFRPGGNPEGARYHGRTADALASEVDEGRGKPR